MANRSTTCYQDFSVCLVACRADTLSRFNCLCSVLFGVGFPGCLIRAAKDTVCSSHRAYPVSATNCQGLGKGQLSLGEADLLFSDRKQSRSWRYLGLHL